MTIAENTTDTIIVAVDDSDISYNALRWTLTNLEFPLLMVATVSALPAPVCYTITPNSITPVERKTTSRLQKVKDIVAGMKVFVSNAG